MIFWFSEWARLSPNSRRLWRDYLGLLCRNFLKFWFLAALYGLRRSQKLWNSHFLRFPRAIKWPRIKISKIPIQQSKMIPVKCPKPISSVLGQFCEKKIEDRRWDLTNFYSHFPICKGWGRHMIRCKSLLSLQKFILRSRLMLNNCIIHSNTKKRSNIPSNRSVSKNLADGTFSCGRDIHI